MVDDSNTTSTKKFDVISFAKNILKQVEDIRSFEKYVDEQTGDNFKIPDESRVNAFFRLVGLPMFVSIKNADKNEQGSASAKVRAMSPGYSNTDRELKFMPYNFANTEKIGDIEVSKELNLRESALQYNENSIGTGALNTDMALSLTIPAPIAANIPDKNSQIEGVIGDDVNFRAAFKKLLPPITSYRRIWPRRNEIAAPFAPQEDRKIDNTTELNRPFIETVARIRLINAANAGNTKDKEREEAQLTSIRGNITKEDYDSIVQTFRALTSADILERFIVAKLFESVEQLANKWVEIKKRQQIVAKQDVFDISIKTTSAKRSPLGKRVDVSTDLNIRQSTSDVGKRLAQLKYREAKEEAFLSLLPSDDIINATKSGQAATTNTSRSALINEFSSLLSSNLVQIQKEIQKEEARIKKNIQQAEQLRLEIDMMTGEFSGLSVVDVVAVIAGLFIIDKEELLALFDEEAISVMKQNNALKSAIESLGGTPTTEKTYNAVKRLDEAVRGIFSLFRAYEKSAENKDKRSAKRGPRKERKQKQSDPSLSHRGT